MRILYTLSFIWLLMLVPVSEASGQELDAKYATTLLPPGSMAPDFSIPSIVEGDTVSLSHVLASGSYVIVDFWASWCSDCRRGIPSMKSLAEEYGEYNLEILIKWEYIEVCYTNGGDYCPFSYYQSSLIESLYGILCSIAENRKELLEVKK